MKSAEEGVVEPQDSEAYVEQELTDLGDSEEWFYDVEIEFLEEALRFYFVVPQPDFFIDQDDHGVLGPVPEDQNDGTQADHEDTDAYDSVVLIGREIFSIRGVYLEDEDYVDVHNETYKPDYPNVYSESIFVT